MRSPAGGCASETLIAGADEADVRVTRALLHTVAVVMRARGISPSRSAGRRSHSEQRGRDEAHRAIRRRLRASPAIKTLKIPEILLDHGFKSHISSAYLNENPDCAALPSREAKEERRRREARRVRKDSPGRGSFRAGARNLAYFTVRSPTENGSCGENARGRR